MPKPKGLKSVKVNGKVYTFTLTPCKDGTLLLIASGHISLYVKDEDEARKILHSVYTQWDAIRGQK